MGDRFLFGKNETSAPQPNPEMQVPVQEMLSLNNAAEIVALQAIEASMPELAAEFKQLATNDEQDSYAFTA